MVSPSGREGRLSVKKDLGAMGEAQTGNDNERVGPAEHCGMPIFVRTRKVIPKVMIDADLLSVVGSLDGTNLGKERRMR